VHSRQILWCAHRRYSLSDPHAIVENRYQAGIDCNSPDRSHLEAIDVGLQLVGSLALRHLLVLQLLRTGEDK